VKGYVKPGEPVAVKFLNENEAGKKALEKIGLAATELEGMFTPATDAAGFEVFTFEGKKLEKKAEPAVKGDGSVDVAAAFPEVKKAGTYVLVWKDAAPLVIETLSNPGRGPKELEKAQGELARVPEDQRANVLKMFEPTVTHIGLLEYAVITTEKGTIKAKFAYDVAPRTVANFVSLARQGFYDGTVFHRIISGFMLQGGDSTGSVEGRAGTGGPGYQIMAELSDKQHERGTLSMARSQDVNSAGSQFFIMHQKSDHLNGGYTAFGDVIEGLNVVDEISKTPVSDKNGTVSGAKPRIESVRILPATKEIYGIGK
jgi:cyclophilin family peptidyl-prolyl cis-trans isomerase